MDTHDDDLDSVDGSEYDEPEYMPGGGTDLGTVIRLGHLELRTTHDFLIHRLEAARVFLEMIGDTDDNRGEWQAYDEDISNALDPETARLAARDLALMLNFEGPIDISAEARDVVSALVAEAPMNVVLRDDVRELLADALAQLSLNDLELANHRDSFQIDGELPADRTFHCRHAVDPPAAPCRQIAGLPHQLILCKISEFPQVIQLSDNRESWNDQLAPIVGCEISWPEINDLLTVYSTSSRSNSRPDKAAVIVRFENGIEINVGAHGYFLEEDIILALDWRDTATALDEYFAAPGGEGLACVTPSHELHQLMSACLAQALESGGQTVAVETQGLDICVNDTWFFDLTTSAGIWNKSLRPSDKKKKTIAAISKYDIASVLLNSEDASVSRLIALSVANCLAVEYPFFYGLDYGHCKQDLRTQYYIYCKLQSMSCGAIAELRSMCYDAAISESVRSMREVDLFEHGEEFKTKANRIISRINACSTSKRVAIPPYPLGEITGLPSGVFSIDICGQNFMAGDYEMQGRTTGPRTDVPTAVSFLQIFPAVGLVSGEGAREIANMLDENELCVHGLVHHGPSLSDRSPCATTKVWEQAGLEYSASSIAQYAEIRSDLVRAIWKNPFPKAHEWVHVYLYKGKVSAWYTARDNPNSPDGYRIDWFAVSTFEVVGSTSICTQAGATLHLWPRQRLRSQEMELAHMLPRKLKLTLASLIEKAGATQTSHDDVLSAWRRLAVTATSSTWASGALYTTCRYLSASISSPSSPFGEMANKIVEPKTFACVFYLERLKKVLTTWETREQYKDRAALLNLPRHFAQLEAYWNIWVPSDYADSNKHLTDCVLGLFDEHQEADACHDIRCADLQAQLDLINSPELCTEDLKHSLRASCALETNGKFGWSFIGSLASAHALYLKTKPAQFDKKLARGTKARHLVNHLTVRHSAYVDYTGAIHKGTVAECILNDGVDDYLSLVEPTFRFYYGKDPVYFNHPKMGELKDREISIAEPKARIQLNNAEYICGQYGAGTSVDMLKVPDKDRKFLKLAEEAMVSGGAIQSSDASRYAPMMSNYAVAIMLCGLGNPEGAMHFKYCASVYAKLAHRRMLIPLSVRSELTSRVSKYSKDHSRELALLEWLDKLSVQHTESGSPIAEYCDAAHTGQGMSHHATSLLHAGALLISTTVAQMAVITINNKVIKLQSNVLVTSDDSTIIVRPTDNQDHDFTRAERQRGCRAFLALQCGARKIALRMVSVIPNLSKEKRSGISGEFNSEDTGIGTACPIMGFREMISQLTTPGAPSLIGDYLQSYAAGRTIALRGQGAVVGNLMQAMLIDATEERWSLRASERDRLIDCSLLPRQLILGTQGSEIYSGPASWMSVNTRANLMALSVRKNAESEELDPHCRDAIFMPLMHVKLSMRKQHRKAITVIKDRAQVLMNKGMYHGRQKLLDALTATLSSARSRGMGRVAARIRGKLVKPKAYMAHEFQRAPILEATLTWIDHVETMLAGLIPSHNDVALSSSLSGTVQVGHIRTMSFPRPNTRRRFRPPKAHKPLFVIRNYGTTPFGRHAIQRSHALSVFEMTAEHRKQVQEYLAFVNYKQFPEHVLYGGTHVISWLTGDSGRLIPIDPTADVAQQIAEGLEWGSFSPNSINRLRELEKEYPDTPILALHANNHGVCVWHTIYQNQRYDVVMSVSEQELQNFDHLHHTIAGGKNVILALQGMVNSRPWSGTGPTQREIRDYQLSEHSDIENKFVDRVVQDIEWNSRICYPTFATSLNVEGRKTLVYIEPSIQARSWHTDGLPPEYVPYARAKVCAELAMGGYWYKSVKGVAFRAFLKGHVGTDNCWPGAVLGWRMSSSSAPRYEDYEPAPSRYKTVCVIGGVDSDEILASVETSSLATGHAALCQSNTEQFDHVVKLDEEDDELISVHNHGYRFYNLLPPAFNYIDAMFPRLDYETDITVEEARAQLIAKITRRQRGGWGRRVNRR